MAHYTMQQAAKLAIDVQDACNLSGVVRSFALITETLCDENRRINGGGSEWVNQHPISVLFASKIASLTGNDYMHADDECRKLAGIE